MKNSGWQWRKREYPSMRL